MSQAQILPTEHFSPSVSLIEGRPATTSLAIAECFGKRHDDVTKSIRNLYANCPEEFRARNFAETFRTVAGPNNSQRQEKFFTIYFDGFILLVMGYTGKKALQMKLAYIEAFNAMREQLENQSLQKMQQLPASDSPLTPDQQCTLQAIIRAKIEALPEDERKGRGLYPQIWSRFNNHFRIARYCQLPQSRMSEAIDYLMKMELAPKALPPSPPTDKESLTVAPAIEPASEQALATTTLDAKTYACGKQFFDDVNKLRLNAEGIREALHIFARPGGRSVFLPHEKQMLYDNANEAANVAVTSLNQAIYALRMIYNIKAHVSFSR